MDIADHHVDMLRRETICRNMTDRRDDGETN